MLIPEISVFLPIFNEEGNIKSTINNTIDVLRRVAGKWELIAVDDGSTDGTAKILAELKSREGRLKVITHKKNRGYGGSLKSGFYGSRYSWVAFTDSDGQFDFSEIENFIKTQKETDADMVIGYYRDRKVSFGKKVTSKMWELLVFIMFGLKVRDIDCGFKFISKKVIDSIPDLESERGAFISSEFLIKAKKKGFKIVEIPVTHRPRRAGVGTGRKLNVIVQSFVDLFRLWQKLN